MKKQTKYPNYFADELGNVYSNFLGKFRKLKPQKLKAGYTNITIRYQEKRQTIYVHRLVLETFKGSPPEGYECCHKNGIKDDNRLANLYWGTRRQNYLDCVKHGNHFPPPPNQVRGSQNGQSKLTEADVIKIRELIDQGFNYPQIATQFNISDRTVGDIKNGKSWSWLK